MEHIVINHIKEYFQPERSNPEVCGGMHFNSRKENDLNDFSWMCERCGSVITRCDGLNTLVKSLP